MCGSKQFRRPIHLAAFLGSMSLVSTALGQTWTNGGNDYNWYNPANWTSPAAVPTSGTNAVINAGSSALTPVLINSGTSAACNTLFLGSTSASNTGYVELDSGSLTTGGSNNNIGLDIADAGTASFTQTAGTVTINTYAFEVGHLQGSSGTYMLSGGILNATAQYNPAIIGDAGTGTFTQSNTDNNGATFTNYVALGNASTGNGSLNLSGNGTCLIKGAYSVNGNNYGLVVGNLGTGAVTQTGATMQCNRGIDIGLRANSNGTYSLSGGSLNATAYYDPTIIGDAGTGTFTQSNTDGKGATFNCYVTLGNASTGNGSINLSGNGTCQINGSYGVHNNSFGLVVGNAGTGAVMQTGGTMQSKYGIDLGLLANSNGTYSISGGTLTIQYSGNPNLVGDAGTGTFSQSGSATVNANYVTLGNASTGNGSIILSGSGAFNITGFDGNSNSLFVGYQGTGVVTQTGATLTTARAVVIGSQAGSNGSYTISGGTLNQNTNGLTIGDAGTGSFTQSASASVTCSTLILGNQHSGTGTYSLGSGTFRPASNVEDVIGNHGTGTFTIAGGTVKVDGGVISKLTVRKYADGSGALSGFGTVQFASGSTGTVFTNNGQVTANGGILDFSSVYSVANTIDNTAGTGTNGWYAQNQGQLKLASVNMASGTTQYFWGGVPASGPSSLARLVNSVELDFSIQPSTLFASVSMSLMSGNAAAAPSTASLAGTPIGLWIYSSNNINNNPGLALTFRYDQVAAKGLTPSLYGYNGSNWISIPGTVDSVDSMFTSTGTFTNSTYKDFAIMAAPANVFFTGSASNGNWDTTTANFVNPPGTGAVTFQTGNNVTFDDSHNPGQYNNSIAAGGVSPGSVTVNSTNTYTFSGGGILTGSLTKSGSGTLILQNTNTYSGGTTINAGTLAVNGTAALGGTSAAVTLNGGTLQFTAGTSNHILETLNNLTLTAGTLDLTNHDLLVPRAASHLSAFRSAVITSTILPDNNGGTPTAAIALLTGREYIALGKTDNQLDDATIQPDDLVGVYTYAGDANLDGRITAADYLALNLGYLFGLTGWTHGDFAQTGLAPTVQDYAIIDNNYLHQSGATSAAGEIALHTQWFGAAYVNALNALDAPVAVPEPASLALLGLGAATLLGRRRRNG